MLDGIAFVINGKAYVGIGDTYSSDPVKTLHEYNPTTDTWTKKAEFPGTARRGAVAFAIGGKGYVGTGAVTDNPPYNNYLDDFWEYDPATNKWTQKAKFPGGARAYASGFAVNGKGYIALGKSNAEGNDGMKGDIWEYDPATNKWTKKTTGGLDYRMNGIGVAAGTKVYVGLGDYGFFHKDFYEFDPATLTVKKN